jgi:hypothetical protein
MRSQAVADVEQTTEAPVFQPDAAMQAILDRQHAEPLSIEDFIDLKDEVFTIVDGEAEVPITLFKAERLKKFEGAPCQNPGSLLFRVAKNWSIPQRLYTVRSEEHHDIVVFLTQVALPTEDNDHFYLETVLN